MRKMEMIGMFMSHFVLTKIVDIGIDVICESGCLINLGKYL